MKSIAKKFTALLLSLMMVFISVFGSAFSVYAVEASEETSAQPAVEQSIDDQTGDEATGDKEISLDAPKATEEVAEETATEPAKEEAQEVAKEEGIEEDAEEAATENPEEEAAPEEVEFEASKTVDGVKVTVKGIFPAEAKTLSVKKLSREAADEAKVAIDEKAGDAEVAEEYLFDICILDKDGNELEPIGDAKVSFETEEVADDSLKAEVFHVMDNGKAEALDVETKGETATVETDGFSVYSLRFTFYDESTGEQHEYDLGAGDTVSANSIALALGFSGRGNVTNASSNTNKVSAYWDEDLDQWMIRANDGWAVNSTFSLELTFANGTSESIRIRTHVHDWAFSASGNRATLYCKGSDTCSHKAGASNPYVKTINASNATYNGLRHGASLTGDLGGGDVTIGDIHYAVGENVTTGGSTDAPINAGTYTAYVSIQPHGASAMTIYTTFTIAKADTIITTDAQAIADLVYNGNSQTLHTKAYAKSKEADATEFTVWYKDVRDTSYSSTNLRTGKDAGTYTINYRALGDANHNPSVEKTLSITISTKGVSITGIDAANKIYDSTKAVSMILTGKHISGVVSGESLTITASGSFNDKNVGTDKPVSYSVTLVAGNDGTKASNYHVASKNNVFANITQKHLLLDWDNATKLQYNGQDQAPTAIIKPGNAQNASDGKVYSGDVVSVNLTADSYKKEVGGPYEAHATNLSGTDAANYYLDDHDSNVGAKFSIVPRVVDVQWADLTQVYDAKVLAPTVKLTDSVAAADGVGVELAAPTSAKDAGTYPSTAQLTGEKRGNFTISSHTLANIFTITKAPLTVKASGWLYYGELIGDIKDQTYEYVSGLKGTDTLDVLQNTGRFETDYGKKYVRVGMASDPATGVTAYKEDGSTEAATYYLLPIFESAQNYEIINEDGELTVYPKPVELDWTVTHAKETSEAIDETEYTYDGKKFTYDATVNEKSYVKVNGIIVEDEIEVYLQDEVERDSNAKTGFDKYTAIAMRLSNPNYSLKYKDGKAISTKTIDFKINQRPIELSWKPSEFTYNGQTQKPEETIDNLQINDEGVQDEVFEITKNVDETSEVIEPEREDKSIEAGDYTISAVELADPNYTLDNGTGLSFDYTINPRAIELKWTPDKTEFTYNGKTQRQSAEVINFADNEDAADMEADAEVVVINKSGDWEARNAGAYVATIEPIETTGRAANYVFTGINRNWKINKLPVQIKWNPTATEYTYNAKEHIYTAEITNIQKDEAGVKDDVTLKTSGTWKAKNAGSYTAKIDGLEKKDSGNYVIAIGTKTSHSWKINKAPQTVGKTTVRNTVASSAKKTNDVIYDAVPGATGYEIAYKHKNSIKWVNKSVGNTTRGTINGLSKKGLYQIKVRAKKAESTNYKSATGAWSNTIYRYFHTTEKIGLKSTSKGSFTMSWAKNSDATSYQVMFSTNKNGSGASKNIINVGKDATSFTKTGLKSGQTYYVQVREIVRVGNVNYIGNISIPQAVKIR